MDVLGTLLRAKRLLVGKQSDWHLPVRLPSPTWTSVRLPGLKSFGPLAVVASVIVSWGAFASAARQEPSAALGLYVGAVAIVLMAWSFVLALRVRLLEPFFGGLDSMYRVHRWAGTLAIVAMFLHTRIEPELDAGVAGASRSVARAAEDLAGVGEVMLYLLVAVSLIRWFPYRWWRLTHKLLGIPFVFACWHFFTATKTYANSSGWGLWFAFIMLAGTAAYLFRVVIRDMILPGTSYRVTDSLVTGSTLELVLEPEGKQIKRRAGQFVVLKVQAPGLREPHIFTVASSPAERKLRFFIRDLGDWTERLHQTRLNGLLVTVEGPYGTFEPLRPVDGPTVWVAGGVGITPFLSSAEDLPISEGGDRPLLFYCVRSIDDAMGLARLEVLRDQGRLDLVLCSSAMGTRFSRELLLEHLDRQGQEVRRGAETTLRDAHVATCGPAGLVAAVENAARSLGAVHVEKEDFDIRQGFGPDLSRTIDRATRTDRKPDHVIA